MSENSRLDRIEDKIDKMNDKLDANLLILMKADSVLSGRVAAVEAWVKGHSTVLAFIGTATIAIIGIIFKLGVK